MVLTHLPYLFAAVVLVLFVRRVRRDVERLAAGLEDRVRRQP